MSKSEIVVVCVRRTSFLKETLPSNKVKVDNVVVVTTPSDLETQSFCKLEKVDCVTTDAFYKNGDPFNKGLAIDEGLKNLRYNDWVAIIDSDILLSPPYTDILKSELDKETLYGCQRIMLESKADYIDFLKKSTFNPHTLDLNSLLNERKDEIGVGYFQLFNMQSDVIKNIKPQTLGHSTEAHERLVQPYNPDSDVVFKQEGQIYPGFPHAGGSDCIFRAFFADHGEMAFSQVPVVHLGAEAAGGHAGNNFIEFN